MPNFENIHCETFENYASCLLTSSSASTRYNNNDANNSKETDTYNVFDTTMNDGTQRRSIGSLVNKGDKSPMKHTCLQHTEVDELRSLILLGTRQLMLALDSVRSLTSPTIHNTEAMGHNSDDFDYVMKPYRRYQDLFDNGEHLEHIHLYYNNTEDTGDKHHSSLLASNDDAQAHPTMNMHTDAGIFIAMTSGYYTNEHQANPHDGLYIKLPSDEVVRVQSGLGEVIIMIGEGGQHWLRSRLGQTFRAVPHLLSLHLDEPGATRAWYGLMVLPPSDAHMPHVHTTDTGTDREQSAVMTYGEYRQRELEYLTSPRNHNTTSALSSLIIPAACGLHSYSSYSTTPPSSAAAVATAVRPQFALTSSTACEDPSSGQPGIKCWAQCMPITSLPCGQAAICVDTVTNLEVDGTKMCKSSAGMHSCAVQCPATPTTAATTATDNTQAGTKPTTSTTNTIVQGYGDNGFCIGPGTSMSMTGFVTTQNSDGSDTDCIIFLFEFWTLNTTFKFILACIGTFIGGILVHCLSKLRNLVLVLPVVSYNNLQKWMILVLIYSIQIVLSYILMLISMTYNVYLFWMVCLGLTAGYAYCNIGLLTHPSHAHTNGSSGGIKGGVYKLTGTSPDPCCGELEEAEVCIRSGIGSGSGGGGVGDEGGIQHSLLYQSSVHSNNGYRR